jgi:hypothetical protein
LSATLDGSARADQAGYRLRLQQRPHPHLDVVEHLTPPACGMAFLAGRSNGRSVLSGRKEVLAADLKVVLR